MILCTKRKWSCLIIHKDVIILCTYKKVVMFNIVWQRYDLMYRKKVVMNMYEIVLIVCTKKIVMYNDVWKCF